MTPIVSEAERIPEQSDFYESDADVEAYAEATSRILFKKIHLRFVAKLLEKFGDRPALTVLDLGTGPGWTSILLSLVRPKWKIIGIDASPAMLQVAVRNAAKNGGRADWRCATAEETELPSGSIDLVVSQFAFHEFKSPQNVLLEVTRVLKNGGYFYFHDAERPPKLFMPLLKAWIRFYYAGSASMRKQATESVRASYTVKEVEAILSGFPLATQVTSAWTIACRMISIIGRKGVRARDEIFDDKISHLRFINPVVRGERHEVGH
jgi:ubiquinone/menaquinone biosynthesis C-methylase UbiE